MRKTNPFIRSNYREFDIEEQKEKKPRNGKITSRSKSKREKRRGHQPIYIFNLKSAGKYGQETKGHEIGRYQRGSRGEREGKKE